MAQGESANYRGPEAKMAGKPFPVGHTAGLHFPGSLATTGCHRIGFWPIACDACHFLSTPAAQTSKFLLSSHSPTRPEEPAEASEDPGDGPIS